MKNHPDVADCAAVGEGLSRDKVLVTAHVMLHAGATANADDLVNYARQYLAAYKVPKIIYVVKDFPRTKNGKIVRRQLDPKAALARSTH